MIQGAAPSPSAGEASRLFGTAPGGINARRSRIQLAWREDPGQAVASAEIAQQAASQMTRKQPDRQLDRQGRTVNWALAGLRTAPPFPRSRTTCWLRKPSPYAEEARTHQPAIANLTSITHFLATWADGTKTVRHSTIKATNDHRYPRVGICPANFSSGDL